MPGMDEVQFLKKGKRVSPDTVRMMLTGYAELGSVIEAVNRRLHFPFSDETLSSRYFDAGFSISLGYTV
jgi:response regulator RpfG family c-di-GMP phosphodiesterase